MMDKEKIEKHNSKVEYNKDPWSWIVDVISMLIFPPMIVMIVYRRGKYNEYISTDERDKWLNNESDENKVL